LFTVILCHFSVRFSDERSSSEHDDSETSSGDETDDDERGSDSRLYKTTHSVSAVHQP